MATAPETPAELLSVLREIGIERTCSRFRRRPIPTGLLRQLIEEGDADGLGRRFIASYPLSPSDLLDTLSREADDDVLRAFLAANPRTPPPVLFSLIEDPVPEVRAAVALNPNLTPREMLKLLRDSEPAVVRELARNPGLKAQHQAFLARHPEPAVRLALALNSALDPQVARALGDDAHPLVRQQAAALARANKNQLLMWADGDDAIVQLGILLRPKLEEEIVRSLALSAHPSVRSEVARQYTLEPAEHVFLMDRGTPAERETLASQKSLPSALQRELCQREEPGLRVALAANPAIGDDIAEYLSREGEEAENIALLENPARSPAWHTFLVDCGTPEISAALVYDDRLAPVHLDLLVNQRLCVDTTIQLAASRRRFPGLRADLAAALARHASPGLRALAASSLQLPTLQLRRLADDPVPTVAKAARRNPNAGAPAPVVEKIPAVLSGAEARWLARINDHLLALLEEPSTRGHPQEAAHSFPNHSN